MENEEKKYNYGKRPLWQWLIVYAVVAVILYGLVYYFVLAKHSSNYSMSSSSTMKTTPSPKPTVMMLQKFSDSKFFQYAYQVFPGALSDNAKLALTGFSMTTKTLSDGSTQVTLTAEKPEYRSQQYVIKPGNKLYLIEMNLQDDDNEANEDKNLHDDTAVVVDPQGYIAQ